MLEALGVPPRQIYLDHGLTGTNRKRPGLDQALAAVRAGDTFVVPKLDRLARSVPDARTIGDELFEQGVALSLGGHVHNPNDPMGKLFFNILATFAEFEVDLLRMRTREGMAVARSEGQVEGAPTEAVCEATAGASADARRRRAQHHGSRRRVLRVKTHRIPGSQANRRQVRFNLTGARLPLVTRFLPTPRIHRLLTPAPPPRPLAAPPSPNTPAQVVRFAPCGLLASPFLKHTKPTTARTTCIGSVYTPGVLPFPVPPRPADALGFPRCAVLL